jgi:hypothetical protein
VKEIFYGAPTVAARIEAEGVTGPIISQACATSVACVQAAAAVENGAAGPQLARSSTMKVPCGSPPHAVESGALRLAEGVSASFTPVATYFSAMVHVVPFAPSHP